MSIVSIEKFENLWTKVKRPLKFLLTTPLKGDKDFHCLLIASGAYSSRMFINRR